MMLVVVPTEYRGGMMVVVLYPMFLTSITKRSLWLLLKFYDLGGNQASLRCVKSHP